MKNMPSALRPSALRPSALVTAVLLASAFLLAGCGHKDTIVGKWQGTVAQPTGTVNSTFEFLPDGKETISINGQAAQAGRPMNIVVDGTYKIDGTDLTQTLMSMTMNGQAFPIPSSQVKPQSGAFTLDGDHLTMPRPGSKETISLTRVKQ